LYAHLGQRRLGFEYEDSLKNRGCRKQLGRKTVLRAEAWGFVSTTGPNSWEERMRKAG
jgi:hypothetical protein